MSTNHFSISTQTVYYLMSVILFFAFLFLSNKIYTAVANPNDVQLPIHFRIADAGEITQGKKHKVSISSAIGNLRYSGEYVPTLKSKISYHGNRIIQGILFLFIFFNIRSLAKHSITHNPFTNKNKKRLLQIGWAFLLIAFLVVYEKSFAIYSFEGNLIDSLECNCEDSAYNAGYRAGTLAREALINPYFLLGFFTLVLANIFRTGTDMKEEADLTI